MWFFKREIDVALISAAKEADIGVIKLLVKNGANVNVKSSCSGDTPLHWACHRQDYEMIDFLLENGADVNVKNKTGVTPLVIICRITGSSKDELGFCNINKPKNKQLDLVKKFIKKGCDIDFKKKTGLSALVYACKNNNHDVAELLFEHKASIAKNQNCFGFFKKLINYIN